MPENPSVEEVDEPDVTADIALLIDAERVNRWDRTNIFDKAFKYLKGDQTLPRPPKKSTPQSRAVQESAITNLTPLLIEKPAELLTLEGYRRGVIYKDGKPESTKATGERSDNFPPEYLVWQRERMDSRQLALWETTLTYGVSYLWLDTRMGKGRERIIQLPTRKTVAYYRDPVNDAYPEVVVWFKRSPFIPSNDDKARGRVPEVGRVVVISTTEVREYDWAATGTFKLASKPVTGPDAEPVPAQWKHGLSRTPVERFTYNMDDEGNVTGQVGKAIPAQNRVNLAVFNADVLNTNGAFKQWWGTGVTPPPIIDPATGKQAIDPTTGQPLFGKIETSPSELLVSPDDKAKFGSLDETPQDGHLNHIQSTMLNLAIVGGVPPHLFLGEFSNLAADALDAVEASFQRWIRGTLQRCFGQSVENFLRLIAEAIGEDDGAHSFAGEVRWKEFALRSFGATMDGLGKGAEMLGIPRRGLWQMVPGVSSSMLESWEALSSKQEIEDVVTQTNDVDAAAARENTGSSFRQTPDSSPVNDFGGGGGTFA